MGDQKKLSSYFLTKRSDFKSPLKKNAEVRNRGPAKLLSLKELFSSPICKNKNEPRPTLSTDNSFSEPATVKPTLEPGSNDLSVSSHNKSIGTVSTTLCSNSKKEGNVQPRLSQEYDDTKTIIRGGAGTGVSDVSSPVSVLTCASPSNPIIQISEDVFKAPTKKNANFAPSRALGDTRKKLFQELSCRRIEKNKLKEPAFKRFSHLCKGNSFGETISMARIKSMETTTATVLPTSLPLPRKYHRLYSMFIAIEDILYLLEKRGEVCYFEKLKNSVERACNMVFTKRHLSMILYLWPGAYRVHLTTLQPLITGVTTLKESKWLVIESGLEEQPSSSKHLSSSVGCYDSASALNEGGGGTTSFTRIADRKHHFLQLLLGLTHQHHQEFLSHLGLDIPLGSLKRWHPSFKLEEVPDVQEYSLPQPEEPVASTAKGMLHLLCYADDTRVTSALQKASEALVQLPVEKAFNSSTSSHSPSSVTTMSPPMPSPSTRTTAHMQAEPSFMKYVPQELMARVKLKEDEAHKRYMLRDPEKDLLLTKLQRLPDLIRCLNNLFVCSKKPCLPMATCAEKLQFSCMPDLSLGVIEEHIELLITKVPQWLQRTKLRGQSYISTPMKNPISVNEAIVIIDSEISSLVRG